MTDEERTRLRAVLASMDAETDKLAAALIILLRLFAGSFIGDSLLALAQSAAKESPENAAIQSAAALLSNALSTTKSQ